MEFWTTIRSLRKARELSQRTLAEAMQHAGMRANVSYISKIENGKLTILPSTELIRAFAAVLNTDSALLLGLTGKFDPKALQARIRAIPELGVLVSHLSDLAMTREQVQHRLALVMDWYPF